MGSRETCSFLAQCVLPKLKGAGQRSSGGGGGLGGGRFTVVSEAGASVYSVSKAAQQELPELEAAHRGAVTQCP